MNGLGYYFYRNIMLAVRNCIILFLLVAAPAYTTAQVSGAAANKYHKALQNKLKHKDAEAYEAMHEAIKADPGFADAYSTLGAWYFTDRKYDKAIDVFVQASRSCKNGNLAFALPLARCLLYNHQPGQAMQLITGNSARTNSEWTTLRKQAQFMQRALANPLKDSVTNLGVRVNTRFPEEIGRAHV